MHLKPGIYRHYKGNLYEVIGIALHSETQEEWVVYKAQYDTDKPLWVRPKKMFRQEPPVISQKITIFWEL